MAIGITPPAGGLARAPGVVWRLLVEAALLAAVILLLLPLFAPLAAQDPGREARFAAPATAELVSQPERASALKNEAMRELLRTASWQWAGAAALGWLLLVLSRHRVAPAIGIAIALIAWATAAWLARVPWPLGSEHTFVLARASARMPSMPARFVLGMIAAGVCLLAVAPLLRGASGVPQRAVSVLAYPGLVLFTGLGFLLILDLSANGHFGNRYLALYHQGHLWLGMLAFTAVAFLRQPLGHALAWTLSLVDGAATRLGSRLGGIASSLLLLSLALVATAAMAAALANMRQLTSELGRLWLIVGGAWFFFLRGTPLTERLARSGSSLGSLARYMWPLLFVVIVLVGAMVFTRDMGPLLIAGYGAGAFVAASVAMWRHQRGGRRVAVYAVAVVLFAAWIAGTTAALFRLGGIDDVTAARLENATAPLASANDHLALVTWFQRAAPAAGFGVGTVPWCGYGASTSCSGLPAQIQSDYTFTALVGVFGWTGAWAITLACVLWLHGIVRRHGAATTGEPRLVRAGGRMSNDDQAFVSWLCVAWVVLALCQLAVTVAGNLAVIPLTGVTFPFVSFGMTSLVANMAMLALAINVNVSPDRARG
ncbi:MAG TPA: FtsW/RodA/SpoVE family cell cycle protein [Casimicrobiaceae bacterium]